MAQENTKDINAAVATMDDSQSSEMTQIISMIGRIASDPNVDISKMQALMEMREREIERTAISEYTAAFSKMQVDLPAIEQRGKIGNKQGGTQSGYALWEDINKQIKPVLTRNGFALSFKTSAGERTSVTAILKHVGGHKEEATVELPNDNSGSKNSVQGVGSSITYGKRYAASAILNLTSHGEDDDAHAAGCDYDIAPWTEKILLCKEEDELRALSEEIKSETDIPPKPKTMIRNAWSGRLKEIRRGSNDATA